MARPRGQFDFRKELCYQLVARLARPTCWASNSHIATELGVSIRQVTRYIAALVKEGRLVLHIKRYLRGGAETKTRRFLHLASAIKGRFGKPVHATPPSRNRYAAPETVTSEAPAPETVTAPKPAFGKPEYIAMDAKTEVHNGVEYEVENEKPGAEPKGPSIDDRIKQMMAILAEDKAIEERILAEEAADPAVQFKNMERRIRRAEVVANAKLDVSHKVPQDA